jgi:hypothetical protein
LTSDEIKNPSNQASRAFNGKFYVLWRGKTAYTASGAVKHFDSEAEAWAYLAQCDRAGQIIE